MISTRSTVWFSVPALLLFAFHAEAGSVSKVSYVSGRAEAHAGAGTPRRLLRVGSLVEEGDTVQTGDKARLEVSLPDGSKLRLAENTELKMTEIVAAPKKERSVSVSLFVGRLWAKVAKAVAGSETFEVETRNAVAGVRGTTFAVQASADLSALVRVYAGTVGVRKAPGDGGFGSKPRERVPPPERVDRKKWEEVILSAMKQVKISSRGEISPAEDFEDAGEELKWVKWNRARDGAPTR